MARQPVDFRHGALRASGNGRFLVHLDGTPFFYLGDTGWEVFHRLTREEADLYLEDRARKGFTVIQAVALSELDGLTRPNAYGELPLTDLDATRPNEAYFCHVDYVIGRAEALGLYVALLPTWGSWAVDEDHVLFDDHHVITPDSALPYGRFLGERYGTRPNVIWVLGGDRKPEGYMDTWRALARGIAEGATGGDDHSRLTMTYHPRGGDSSSEKLHEEPWLTFNMVQSGHHRDGKPYRLIEHDYGLSPPKPVINAEPGYEHIPNHLKAGTEKLDDADVRRFAYWSVFAGACGHTYGANEIWMMWSPEVEPITPVVTPLLDADIPWSEAIHLPGSAQMGHLRRLVESRPFLSRIPDQELLASGEGDGLAHIQATRCPQGSYAMIYIPQPGQAVECRLDRLAGGPKTAWWFDPRDGSVAEAPGVRSGARTAAFAAPQDGGDHILVIDEAARGFPPPGTCP
jgi:hypothetical protein